MVEAMGVSRVGALLGPGQSGRSTLARMLAADRLPADYLTLDDEPVRSLASADPAGFVAVTTPAPVADTSRQSGTSESTISEW
ncbi:MAG TPA: hypothetical protein VG165_02935 [Solirubrobacteraceae bacterium]|nr:hypothetical protein [Solirubrobacteraceae bacterium]